MDLSKDEQYLLGLVIKTASSIHSAEAFTQTLYPIVCELFPHKKFACEIGLPNDHARYHRLNLSFPAEYLPTQLAEEGISDNPLSRIWLQEQKPQYLDKTRLFESANADGPWLSAFQQDIFKNIAGHGIFNHATKYMSFFYFADIVRGWNAESIFLLKLFIPHLHAALVNANLTGWDTVKNKNLIFIKPEHNLSLAYST